MYAMPVFKNSGGTNECCMKTYCTAAVLNVLYVNLIWHTTTGQHIPTICKMFSALHKHCSLSYTIFVFATYIFKDF